MDIKVIFGTIACMIAVTAVAQNDQVMVRKGNEHYKKEEYDQAAEAYKKAAEANSKNTKAQYNLGNALYKKKKLEDASKAFESVAEGTTDKPLRANAYYNKGVAYTRNKQLMESIDAYKQSLRVNPADEQVRENLQLALNELKKQQNNQDQNKQNQQNKNQEKPEPKNNSKLNKQQVEKMLNALREEEKRLQQNKQQKTKAGGAQEKDW
jgi:Ca-activated chloride channel family protein